MHNKETMNKMRKIQLYRNTVMTNSVLRVTLSVSHLDSPPEAPNDGLQMDRCLIFLSLEIT